MKWYRIVILGMSLLFLQNAWGAHEGSVNIYDNAPTTTAKAVQSRLIVRLIEGVDFMDWWAQCTAQRSQLPSLSAHRQLGRSHNFHRLTAMEDWTLPQLQWLRTQPDVLAVQYDFQIEWRNTPSDAEWFRQEDMAIIEAEEAWTISTGGATANGTPIVVAVFDSGYDPDHPDLVDNLWHNPAEIIGDGIDNDNNGYIDDDIGWDFFTNTPNIAPGVHGLSSAGVIGARGDNGMGVSGVNWQIELQLFSFSFISDLIEGYEYVIDQRRRFNESNGAEGAFVVATSNSFGVSQEYCSQHEAWGQMYDLLGAEGILSSSGVANFRYDADVDGDMPGNCPSDFLVISCNTDLDDNLYETSAYGQQTVDLGSPGEGTYTLRGNDGYGNYGGNSAATPHVTGAIALLYSLSETAVLEEALQNPAGMALRIKEVILASGDELPSLEGRTLTGKRLNLGQAMESWALQYRGTPLAPFSLAINPNPTDDWLTVNYTVPVHGTYRAQLFDALGRLVIYEQVEAAVDTAHRFTLDVERLPPGVYHLQFGKSDDWVTTKVVVY